MLDANAQALNQSQVPRRMLYTKAQVSRPKLKAKRKSKAPGLKEMPWINAKAVFSVSLTVFTLESIYIQSKSPFQNPKSPIYNAINPSLPFTTLCFLFKTQVSHLQPYFQLCIQ